MPKKGVGRCKCGWRRYEVVEDRYPRYLVRCLGCKKEKWTRARFSMYNWPKAKDFRDER